MLAQVQRPQFADITASEMQVKAKPLTLTEEDIKNIEQEIVHNINELKKI